MPSLASRLYFGEIGIDAVGRRRLWFTVSAVLVLVSVVAMFWPGLKFGIDFRGGAVFRVRTEQNLTVQQVRDALGPVAEVVQVTTSEPREVIVQTDQLPDNRVAELRAELAKLAGVTSNEVNTSTIGSKWGSTVTRRALIALGAFFLVVAIYVSIRFEPKMVVGALVAVLHDLVITGGIYALAGFEVTPATIIALLTILGYSLYDTVVVFDKVKENTGELTSMSRITYSEAANLAVNQTLIRSLNTSLSSLLPIGALLLVGVYLLGAETLKELALAQFIGVGVSTYSSVFVATPVVAALKEREPRFRQLAARVARLREAGAVPEPGKAPAKAAPAPGHRAPAPRQATAEAGAAAPAAPPDRAGEEAEGAPAPVAAAASKSRPAQKPRSAAQRRKGSGRKPSSAKRRRR